MIFTKENKQKQKANWSQIPDHPYRILIIETQGLENQIHYLI